VASFQTIRLSRGRHDSPREGTCVAELVSMLAGERYSDHPRCACPALVAFLRGYNDGLDDVRRQELIALAPALVGTRATEARTTARGDALVALAWRYERQVGPLRLGPVLNYPTRFHRYEAAGAHLGRCARRQPDCHRHVLATLRALAGDLAVDGLEAVGAEQGGEHRGDLAGEPRRDEHPGAQRGGDPHRDAVGAGQQLAEHAA
jgi:hypothetical protein